MADPLLSVDLEIRLGDLVVQPRFTAEAERVILFGPSGAGKSVTLRTIAGLVRPSAGHVRLGGRILDDHAQGIHQPPQERRVGYVPQQYALFPHLTVRENIAYGLHRLPREARRVRVEELLDRMRLGDRADRRPHELSGGQQQRAALARALAPSPEMLLMDEPFAALEESLRVELREEVRRLQSQDRIPVLLVTHNLEEAYSLADRLVVFLGGRVVQVGPREDVFRHPATPEVARLMGMLNVIDGVVEASEAKGVVLRWQGVHLRAAESSSVGAGGTARVGMRPEELMILREAPVPSLGENLLPGIVTADRPQGYDHLLSFQVDQAGELTIRIPHPVVMRLQIQVGSRRVVAIRPEAIHVFASSGSTPAQPTS